MCESWISCNSRFGLFWRMVLTASGFVTWPAKLTQMIPNGAKCMNVVDFTAWWKMYDFMLPFGQLSVRVVWCYFSSRCLFYLRIAPLLFALVVCIVVQWNRQVLWNAGAGENVDNWATTTKLHRQRAVHSHFKWKVSSKMLSMWFVDINTPVPCLPIKVPIAGEMASMVSFNDMMRFGPRQVVGSWD